MDLKDIKTLFKFLQEHDDLEEIEVEKKGVRIRLRRRSGPSAPMSLPAPPPVTEEATPIVEKAVPPAPSLITVESPMVGTFYRAPAPTAEPFVREGDLVSKGTVLCIIEAMKLMNEIEAEVSGRVASIVVENGQPVEYGQPLLLLEQM